MGRDGIGGMQGADRATDRKVPAGAVSADTWTPSKTLEGCMTKRDHFYAANRLARKLSAQGDRLNRKTMRAYFGHLKAALSH